MTTSKDNKTETIWDTYHEHDFIDAKDNQGDWRVGYIIAKLQHTKNYKVRFDGWASKYDETYKHNTLKLKPFRTIVIGYTGQQQNPALRQDWKFAPSDHVTRVQKMKAFLLQPEKHTVHQLNQLVRGHNYMYNDFLMTYKFHNPQGIAAAIEYFELNVVFLSSYLKNINNHFQEYFRVISNNQEIQLWSNSQAYFKSYYEIFDTNYTSWGCYDRLASFFRDNGELVKAHFLEAKKQPKKLLQYHLTKLLMEHKGLQAIVSIIDKLHKYEELIPFLFLHSFTNLLNAIYSLISTVEKQKIIDKMVKIGEHNFAKLKENDLRELHKHQVSNFLNALVALTHKTEFQNKISLWTTERELQLALKLIICPFFEKKLKGINYLQQVCQKYDFILKNEWFKNWAEKVKLYQILFMNNDNHEFAKKACELVKYLYLRKNLSEKDIDLILHSRLGKHQTVVKEIYNLVADFGSYQSLVQDKLELFTKVANVPEQQWDQDYIHMIRTLSQNCYGINEKERLSEPFGFFMVYNYAVRVESDFSLSELSYLLLRIEKSKIYNKFQEDCFKSIEKQHKVWIHIKILLILCHHRIQNFDKLTSPLIKILINCITKHSETNSSKIIEDALELLAEVVKNTNKDIQFEEIDHIWRVLTKSQHRECFLKWLFKKKQTGRVTLNQCLNEKHRRHLLFILWQNEEEIKQMDQNQALFMIELFKSVNISSHKMSRFNIIIKPDSLELQAYQKLWTVFRVANNDKVSELFSDLLAEIHCNYTINLSDSIQNLLCNVTTSLRTSIDTQDITYLKRLLSLTQKLILRDQEVLPQGYVPRMNYTRQYTVLNRDNNQEKILKYNCMNNFYQFKKLISERFQIPMFKLSIYNSKQQLVKLQSYYKSMNELSSGKFQICENFEYQSIVKTCLNSNLDLFFELLDDKRIEKQVWSIVERLPISDDLKFKLVQTQDILTEINKAGFYKQLYELKVVTQLSEQWWLKFTNESNLNQLANNFSKVNYKTHIQLEYIATLTNIIQKMLAIRDKADLQLKIPLNLCETIFQILKNLLSSINQDGIQNSQLEIKIIKNLFSILEHVNKIPHFSVFQKLINFKQCQQLIVAGLIQAPTLPLRKIFSMNLKSLLRPDSPQLNTRYLDILLGNILNLVVSIEDKRHVKQYFIVTSFFLSLIPNKQIIQYNQKQEKSLALKIFDLIHKQSPQVSTDSPNMLLIGYLSILKHFLMGQSHELLYKIAQFIIFRCLFADNQSFCKSKQSRSQSFSLLRILFCQQQKVFEEGSKYLVQLHRTGQWRTKRLDDWTVTLSDKMKSPTGYVGLKNLGCICYMNSLMQQLFMIPKFRYTMINCEEMTNCEETINSEEMIDCEDPAFTPALKQENLLYQVQKMFLNLWLSQKKFYNPKEFCHAFKDYEGNPTNVSQQMDIDEFSNILFDRLENQMKHTSHPTLIKDMFGGVFSNEIVCKGCPHFSETEEHFLSISLTVKNKKNIYQSLDTMIKGDTLDGDNAYYCERCNKKVSAVKRVSLKKLPDYLIVTLKRFEFDYEKMMKLKVNEYCEFPTNLNLRQYSRQHLRKQETAKALEEQDDLSNQYFNYILKGVVVHLGYADSGHYYSYIQDRSTSKWFEFNDTVVRNFNIDDLAQEAFGGETTGYDAKQKIKNAYMLIYQRQKKLGSEKEIATCKEQIAQKPYNEPILKQIMNENKEQKIQSLLFSEQYNAFVNGLLGHLDQLNPVQQKQVLKYAITFYLTITLREKNEGGIYPLLKKINSKLDKNDDLKQWLVRLFSQKKIFQEFFKNCIIRQVKKLLAQLLVEYYSECDRQTQEHFCNLIINILTQDNQNCLEYCLMLYQIGKKCPRSLDYLVANGIVGRFIENIVRKQPRVFVKQLQIVQQTNSQIGNEIVFQKPDSEKKLKFDNQNGYIWGLINLIVSRSKELNKPLKQYITPIQETYLYLPDTKILKILQEIKNKFQMFEFLNLITYLSTNNKQFLAVLSKLVLQGLKDFQSKRYRQFFMLFQKIISINDDLKDLRLQAFRNLQEGLIHNQKYSLDSNIIQQWIIIIINRNQVLRSHIQNDKMLLNFLFKAATKKIPSEEVARKNNAYGDFMINKLHGVKFPKTKKGYNKLSEDMAEFYEQIINNKFQQSHIWPSVHQTQSIDFKVGEVIAYFEPKDKIDYQQAHVQNIFMNRLELHFKKNRVVHFWKDDEKLSHDIKFVNNDEENELNSSRTTEMEIEDEEDYIEDL